MLAKLTDLKAWPGMPTDQDTLLTLILNAVGKRFSRHCRRGLEFGAAITELHDGGGELFWVNNCPIATPGDVGPIIKELASQDWENASALVEDEDYWFEKDTGRVWRKGAAIWLPGRRTVYAYYFGGYVDPATTPLPPGTEYVPVDLQMACMEQSRFIWQRRNELGLTGVSTAGGNISIVTDAPLLKSVEAALKPYVRYGPYGARI